MNEKSVAAIVPAHDEDKRIEPVLKALVECQDISEIIVVDDGSSEPLDAICSHYPRVRLIRHEHNRGKAAAMTTGAAASTSEYLFFCDADLVGLLSEHVSAMVEPVVSGTYEMFIGLRDNPAQRAVFLFALNSGERCISKKNWDALPSFYKKSFRVETGLNFLVKKHRGKLGYKVFPYRNTLREKKYGFLKGATSRLYLSFEVFCAWIYIACVDFWK